MIIFNDYVYSECALPRVTCCLPLYFVRYIPLHSLTLKWFNNLKNCQKSQCSQSCEKLGAEMVKIVVVSFTQAYVDFFSQALNYEYGHRGITIQCLIPYYVATRMTEFSSTLSNPNLLIPNASTYARHALATLGWSVRTTGYWPHTLQVSPLITLHSLQNFSLWLVSLD